MSPSMLDAFIIDQILKRERGREKRREWEPQPLELPLYEPLPLEKEEISEPAEIDIGEQEDAGLTIIQMFSYRQQTPKYYS